MARPLTDRQLVARTFRGQLTKPIGDYTDAYVRRLAASIRKARSEGVKPTRQAARGHRQRPAGGAGEHPAQFVVRDVDGRRQRVSTRGVKPTRVGVIVQREYRSIPAAYRWHASLPGDVATQIVGHGELRPEYGHDEAIREDEDGELPQDEQVRVWRSVYTGNARGDEDEAGVTLRSLAELDAALDRVFVPGSVDRLIVRWQR